MKYTPHIFIGSILLLAAMLYAPAVGFDFVLLDDPMLVSENPLIIDPTLADVMNAVSSYDPELYVPLTTLSYQLESLLFGMKPWHFHAVNILLHIACITLVFFFIQRLTRSVFQATIVASLFAVHPINTETVIWISARKDLLSTFFALSSLMFYLRYRDTRKLLEFCACLLFFLLALLSKGTVLVLPGVFLLIDWWQKRKDGARAIIEKIPLAALSIIFFIIALVGKSVLIARASLADMILVAFRSIVFYLSLLFVPVKQSAIYVYEHAVSVASPDIAAAILTVIGLSSAAVLMRKRFPVVLFGWAWFLIWLLPSFFHYSHDGVTITVASDRYAYVAAIGIFCVIAWFAELLRSRVASYVWRRRALFACALCIVMLLSTLTVRRSQVWADGLTLSADVLSQYPREYHSRYNLALAYSMRGETEKAKTEYRATIDINPRFVNAYLNLGSLLAEGGDLSMAIAVFKEGIAARPDSPQLQYNLALSYHKLSQWDAAIHSYKEAISLEPLYRDAYRNLAVALGKKGLFAEALKTYASLAAIDPEFAQELTKKGVTLHQK